MYGLENYIPNNYVRALIIILIVFLALRIFVFIVQKIILKITTKTKTDLDDKLVERLSKPLTFIILIIGFYIASFEFILSEFARGILENIFASLIVISIGIITYAFFDVIIIHAFKKIAKKTKSSLDDGLMSLANSVLKAAWIIFALLYILSIWGIEIGPFLAGLGIGGIAIAFAMQESLSNIFGGISLILDKTLKVGDLIYLDSEARGEILEIGLRSTKIKTFDNEVMIVPNSMVAKNKVQNLAQPEPKSRVVLPFGVAYGTDIEKVKKVVLKEIRSVKNFVDDPEPLVRFLEMGESSLNFKAYFFVDSYEHRFSAIDEANTKIYNALNKAKIHIPFPQMDVHLKKK
jgi:MscS family membrane protein